jgi:lipoprotein-anchoring transpeptidase ErfK/SrfK
MPSPAIVLVAPAAAPFVAVGGNSGDETARIQQRLLELGFWLTGVDGEYGLTTSQAVMAFQKYHGLEATARVDQATADTLTNVTLRAHGRADAGTLVEIDKDRQILFVVQSGRTVWVFNVSTGNGEQYTESDQNTPGETITGVSLTPNGLHAVNRERAEGWWEGDLGRIYRPKYFVGGVAVHGSGNVPNYPASHGCVRVTTVAMDFIWDANLMPMGVPVWVHGAN